MGFKLSDLNPFKAGAKAVTEVAGDVADIVERWAPGDESKNKMRLDIEAAVQKGVAEARAYDPRSTGGGWIGEFINVFIDAVNRAIRPAVAIMLIGGVFGFWNLQTQTVDPIVLHWGEAVVIFYFGARSLVKDLPQMIEALRAAMKK